MVEGDNQLPKIVLSLPHVCIHTHTHRERDRERGTERWGGERDTERGGQRDRERERGNMSKTPRFLVASGPRS